MAERSAPKTRKKKNIAKSNANIPADNLYFDGHDELNNITNTYFNSLDMLLTKPNESRLSDIEDLISDTMDQYNDLIRREVKKRLKSPT
jgi:hypothetical protein